MTNAAPLTDSRIDSYLAQLGAALGRVSQPEKEDILREIRAHIVDSTEGAPDHHGAVERVLRLLGTPEQLAKRYTTECLLTRAGRSFSPWLLLKTSCRWAMLGIKGTVAFFVAVLGYGLALGLTACVLLKPFMPDYIGVWAGRGGFQIGMPPNTEGMYELLGNNFIPVMAVCAFAIGVGTTQALRWLIRKRGSSTAY